MSKIYVIGSGTPTPTADRFGSAYVVDTGLEKVLFDCGPATTHKLARAGLQATDIDVIFLTHHHYDHVIDLPCFLMVRWDHQKPDTRPVSVYGPAPTSDFVDCLIGANGVLKRDIHARSEHPASQRIYQTRGGRLPRPQPTWEASDLVAGDEVPGASWTVRTARAAHVQPFHESLAYRIETSGGSVVVTGDTARCPEVTDLARGADMMLCCCWDHADGADQIDARVTEGMSGNMCGPEDAALMAAEARVKHLVLVHHTPSIAEPEAASRAVRVAREIFDGEVTFAHEGLTLNV